MLCQDIVSTPRSKPNCDFVEHEGSDNTDVVVDFGQPFLEVGKRGLVAQRGVFAHVVVVVGIAHGLVQEVLLVVDVQDPRDVELVVISAMRAFDVGILLTVALVVLNELAAEASDQLA